ncbi:MAG: hypothetical protein J3R72DRAFT_449614 [Linnemannia gamsii]|nr:MAG: hypothetical protein J3R72DRAFT_449614 [Linnemannia gamsii]
MPALLTTNADTATTSIAATSNNNNHDIDRSGSLSTSLLPVSSTATATTPTSTTTSTLQTQNTHAACSTLRRLSTPASLSPASLSPSPFEVASLSSLPLHASSSFCSTPSSFSFSCAQSPYSSSCATLSSPIADLSFPQPATALLPSSPPPTLPTSLSQQQQQQQQQQQRALPLQYQQQQQASTLTSSPMQIVGSALTGCSASPSETENLPGLVSNLNAASGSNGPTATATASTTEATTAPEPTASPSASDIVQHCLLFPTYATRHSRSGKKNNPHPPALFLRSTGEDTESTFSLAIKHNHKRKQK